MEWSLGVDESSLPSSTARKRQRIEEAPQLSSGDAYYDTSDGSKNNKSNGNHDDEDISHLLMNGDDFLTDEQTQEEELRRRREQRKKRLASFSDGAAEQEANFATQPLPTTNSIDHEALPSLNDTRKQLLLEQSASPIATTHSIIKVPNDRIMNRGNNTGHHSDEDDGFNMFSSSVSPIEGEPVLSSHASKRGHEQQDWDDAEGYYKAVIGEIIELEHRNSSDDSTLTNRSSAVSFRVSGAIGKGVFSTVLKCTTVSNSTSIEIPPTVAVKCIRHNETMVKASQKELNTLLRLKGSPGIVPLLLPVSSNALEYRGHVVMVFSFMEYNLREVLQKFGKGVGLSLQAVRSYYGQLLAAATHLKKHGIIHADLKPDNILVSADFGIVQLADFGSAIDINSPEQSQPTPYMVSRFYRAPEIILGLPPSDAIDLWSLAVSVAELFLGNVLFQGQSNNDMLYVFMQHLGPFSNRVIRQHFGQCQRLPIRRHFQQAGANYVFTQEAVDPVTGAPLHKALSLVPQSNNDRFPLATPLRQKLLKAKSAKESRKMVLQFAELLEKCLVLDPSRRIALKDALKHEFFTVKAVPRND